MLCLCPSTCSDLQVPSMWYIESNPHHGPQQLSSLPKNLTFPRCGEERTTCSITSMIDQKDRPVTVFFGLGFDKEHTNLAAEKTKASCFDVSKLEESKGCNSPKCAAKRKWIWRVFDGRQTKLRQFPALHAIIRNCTWSGGSSCVPYLLFLQDANSHSQHYHSQPTSRMNHGPNKPNILITIAVMISCTSFLIQIDQEWILVWLQCIYIDYHWFMKLWHWDRSRDVGWRLACPTLTSSPGAFDVCRKKWLMDRSCTSHHRKIGIEGIGGNAVQLRKETGA